MGSRKVCKLHPSRVALLMAGQRRHPATAQLPAWESRDGSTNTETWSVLMLPRSGDVVHVGKAASVQFSAPILFRIIRVHDWPTYDGWIWLDGYELNNAGDATERRSIFVQLSGLRAVGKAPDPRARSGRVPGGGVQRGVPRNVRVPDQALRARANAR